MTRRGRALFKLTMLLGLLGLLWLALRDMPAGAPVAALRDNWWGPAAFVAVYAALAAVNVSGLALTLAGGAVFGFSLGALLNTLGANLGATGSFWLARALGRDGVRALAGERFAGVDRVAAERGAMWLLRLRLIPVVPFNVLNFVAGLSAMPWRRYAMATALGILPGTLIYTYFADAIVAGVSGGSRGALVRVVAAGVLLALLSFLPGVARRLRWVERP